MTLVIFVPGTGLGTIGFSPSQNLTNIVFAMGLGGGVDVTLNRHMAVRVIQIDYIGAFPDNNTDNNLRLSTGLV